jgi:hypothetical protein
MRHRVPRRAKKAVTVDQGRPSPLVRDKPTAHGAEGTYGEFVGGGTQQIAGGDERLDLRVVAGSLDGAVEC